MFYGRENDFCFHFVASLKNYLKVNEKTTELLSISNLITRFRTSVSPRQLSTFAYVFWDCKN